MLNVVMLSVILLNVILLNVILLNVILLNVILLNVILLIILYSQNFKIILWLGGSTGQYYKFFTVVSVALAFHLHPIIIFGQG
jgi:hypothetical protein